MLEMDDHLQALNIEKWRVTIESTQALEDISLDDSRLNWVTRIGTQAKPLVHKELTLFLKNNQDVFAWSHKDILGINPGVMVHQFNVSSSFPLIQKKTRVFSQERDKAIAKKVRKLLEAGFIREVYYPNWLASMVMVKKMNGKWRMCVDLTDPNKACLKDSYPLPRIDLLVDSMVGH